MSISINGEGTKLWGLVRADSDRSRDTSLEMWLANDEEHLKEQILEEWLESTCEGDWLRKEIEKDFENDWDCSILPFEIDLSGLMKPWTKL
jgi:hypothetical protein